MPALLGDFVDIHVHILPGIDDGPKDMAGSIELARSYERAGITRLFATSHFLPGTAWSADNETILQLISDVQAVLDAEHIDLQILPGMEIAYHQRMTERIFSGQVLALGESGYFLVEPPFHGVVDDLYESLLYLLEQEIKLIVAHPERIETFRQRPDLIQKLVLAGARTQVNTGSLLGYFGSACKAFAQDLWNNGLLHHIACDAHDHEIRAPLTSSQWETLRNLPDGEQLLLHCSRNNRELADHV
jgi:protein-tyrosine phosphatase